MPRRVNLIVLLGMILALVISFGIFAGAQGGGTASDAIGIGQAQMGKGFMQGTDGPNTFSCSGLMRFILRESGVDTDAPWVPEAYLSKYTPVGLDQLQPGDIVIMPNWATMYVGNDMLLNSNEALGEVTLTPLSSVTPLGAARPPYGGGGGAPLPTEPAPVDPMATDVPVDPAATDVVDPVATDVVDPLVQQATDVVDPLTQQATDVVDPLTQQATDVVDPLAQQAVDVVDPLATNVVDPLLQS
jgi:hypothetical protein